MRKWLERIGIASGIWAVIRTIWAVIGHYGNFQTLWGLVKDWPTYLKYAALIIGSQWLPVVLAVLCLVTWWVLKKTGRSYDASQIRMELIPKWGFPILATVINNDRDYPAHVKRSTLYGIKKRGHRERLYEASKFRTCLKAPYTIDPQRRVEQAYGGYIPFETFKFLQTEIELENGKIFVSNKAKSPRPPRDKYKPIESAPPADAVQESDAFEIDATSISDLQNRTERAFERVKRPSWSLDCQLSVRNRDLTQGIHDVRVRILDISPPMVAYPSHKPRTQDATLRRIQYEFDDIAPGKALLGGQAGHVRILHATKFIKFMETMAGKSGNTEVHVTFFGKWPDAAETVEFVAGSKHVLTMEVAGFGIQCQSEQFLLQFSTEWDKAVMTIKKIEAMPPS